MPALVKHFKDLDLNFLPHPTSGDIGSLIDADAVKRSIRNLMLTDIYERVFQPDLGAGLKHMLFDPITITTERKLDTVIRDVIRNFEPRVTIIELQVQAKPDENGYSVTLTFAIDAISEIVSMTVFLERVR